MGDIRVNARFGLMCRSFQKIQPILLGWILLGVAMTGHAQTSSEQNEIQEMEYVQVTATRRPAQLLDVSEAITVIDNAAISNEAPGVLAEMLRGQTGTFFQQTTPGQGIPIFRKPKESSSRQTAARRMLRPETQRFGERRIDVVASQTRRPDRFLRKTLSMIAVTNKA